MTRGIVFDLDDTLYLERDFVRGGFEEAARRAAADQPERHGIAAWLWTAFERGVRGDTFDRLLAAYPDLIGRVTVADLVDAYRRHRPRIELAPGTADRLTALGSAGSRLGVLTDGPLASQRSKADALDLRRWFDPIVFTASHGDGSPKPSTGGFAWIATAWRLPAEELAYVADNPAKDFVCPRSLGWRTVRVRRTGQLTEALEAPDDEHRPDVEVPDLAAAIRHLAP